MPRGMESPGFSRGEEVNILFTCYTEYVHIEMKEETNEHHNQRPNQPSHRIRMGPILPAPLHQQLGAQQELCSPMLREARHHRSALKEKTMKSYKTYAEEYGLDIEVVRWVFNHIRVTRYVMSEPIGYKIAFKYLGQPVHLSSNWKTGVAEKSFREIVNIRRKVNTTEANPELVPDKD